MQKYDGSMPLKAIDALCKGKGYAMGQIKKTDGKTGKVTYHFSMPKTHFWQIRAKIWYYFHKRDIIKRRKNP